MLYTGYFISQCEQTLGTSSQIPENHIGRTFSNHKQVILNEAGNILQKKNKPYRTRRQCSIRQAQANPKRQFHGIKTKKTQMITIQLMCRLASSSPPVSTAATTTTVPPGLPIILSATARTAVIPPITSITVIPPIIATIPVRPI